MQHIGEHTKGAQRHGFTLVELLVVIAIIGALFALLLPAIQASRESARRVICQNNLRQSILGVLNYVSAHDGTLPSLWKTDNVNPWENFSWRVDVLPYLESSPLYESLNNRQPPNSPTNRSAIGVIISTYQCPSTPESPRTIQSLGPAGSGYEDIWAGACDYSAIHDVANDESEVPLPGAWRSLARSELEIEEPGDGVGGNPTSVNEDRYNPQLRIKPGRLKMIEDGQSNTAMLVEQAGKPLQYDQTRASVVIPQPSEGAWATAEFASFYAAGVNRNNLKGIYSFHNGAHVVMCDGSVHSFSADMEVEVITALLSRNGDEIINKEDWQ